MVPDYPSPESSEPAEPEIDAKSLRGRAQRLIALLESDKPDQDEVVVLLNVVVRDHVDSRTDAIVRAIADGRYKAAALELRHSFHNMDLAPVQQGRVQGPVRRRRQVSVAPPSRKRGGGGRRG